MMMLSPLTISVPSDFEFPSSLTSSALSRERFMCWSNPCRAPLMTFPPFSLIRTTLPKLSSRTFTAISTDKPTSLFHASCAIYLSVRCPDVDEEMGPLPPRLAGDDRQDPREAVSQPRPPPLCAGLGRRTERGGCLREPR